MSTGAAAFVRPRTLAPADLRLVVVPHAGGSGAVYHPMTRCLPPSWELLLLDLPGRGKRHGLPPLTDMKALVAQVTDDVVALADGTPLALFGHSFGAVVAAETARSLESRGTVPLWVGVSGRQAPAVRPGIRLLDPTLSEVELARRLTRLGGMPDRLDELPEFRARFLQLIRSDLRALDSYRPAAGRRPLTGDLTAFAATDDALAPAAGAAAWAPETTGAFRRRIFPGGHFHFLKDAFRAFTAAVVAEIEETRGRLSPSSAPTGREETA
ncbi:alpha/beta fold hydrolase [Streptomyces sp. MAA16]|uniref:thioesterase II family protein n=1 Tax=Streptomyces sp. MAA16 TaxID=3035116 RepID=UPI002474B38A|nr:alpha/beta fold hydrolase [Streptomyces sp. MAA16]MDH6696263.1 surfactin synthase thioesterase subunit [Streptomyces sp. MAA16]